MIYNLLKLYCFKLYNRAFSVGMEAYVQSTNNYNSVFLNTFISLKKKQLMFVTRKMCSKFQ